MVSEHVGDMTRDELEQLVTRIVERRLRQYPYVQHSHRPLAAVWQSMLADIITTEPGQPSTLEMLREDRNR